MEQQLEEIREQQKATWNKFSPGWKKWDDFTMDFLKPCGDEMIRQLNLKDYDKVLDIAGGTGEPGLTIASKLRKGKVIITDLADDMLIIAHENATKKGIKNVEFNVCDAGELPFANNIFDAVSCRLGFMFFPDMLLAAKEMFRVLKPGGRISLAVWGVPEKNFWITATMGAIKKNIEMPAPPPGSPGIFRCAKDGQMTGLLTQAGFKNVLQKEIAGKMKCKSTDEYWDYMNSVVAPVVSALNNTDTATKEKIQREVYEALNQKYPDGNISIDASALIIYGQK